MTIIPVGIVMPMRDASTTVLHALKSLKKQKYPIREIIVVDNKSKDNSVEIVESFAKESKIPIKLIARKENKGVGSSFNTGVKNTKSSLVVLMHADCSLQTEKELGRLIKPMEDKNIVATYPTIILSEGIWNTFNFWEKYFFARLVNKGIAGFTTKFDCVRREAYLGVGGIDIENFGVGNEDADLHYKLKKAGKVMKSDAIVTHLYYLGSGYSLAMLLHKQRHVARSYGRAMRTRGFFMIKDGLILFVKPSLAIIVFLPFLHVIGVVLLILYSFFYTQKMFTTKSTLKDPRILILPFLNIFLLYFETFWIIESFLFGKNKIE